MVLKDQPRTVRSPTNSRPNSRPNSSRKSSTSRLLSARSSESKPKLNSTLPRTIKPTQDGDKFYTSNEILVRLFEVWQPQLCASYRPHVEYVPTDPELIKAYIDTMTIDKHHGHHTRDRFRAVERVVETVNHLNFASHRGRESRMSYGNLKFTLTGGNLDKNA